MIRCRTLGALELTDSGGREHTAVLAQPKRAALLIYLAVANPGGFHRRDSLLALFWPELDQEHARAALRQALTFLRAELGEAAIRTRGLEEVGVDPERVWCDVVGFEDAVRAGDLERALELYRGDLLPGFHISGSGEWESWLEQERTRLRDRASDAATELRDRAEQAGLTIEAIRWARRGLALKPDDEPAVQRLVVLLNRSGDRAGALREYEAFATRLDAEYDAQPSPATRALMEGLRNDATSLVVSTRSASPDTWTKALLPAKRRSGRRIVLGAGTLLAVTAAGLLLLRSGRELRSAADPAFERTAIAVLPFQSLSVDQAHAYFATGLHDELLTQLSKVAGLKVIGRASVMRYQGPNLPPLRQIASELAVGSVVEASVQVVGAGLRVNVQLNHAVTGTTVWAERYDRALDDAFAIQSDVAQQIVRAVGAALSSGERQALTAPPTVNPEAYRFYLHGQDFYTRPGRFRKDRENAEQLYERALALDPSFALAHAALAVVNSWTYFIRWDPSVRRLVRAREEAEAALRLAPDLPESHIAMGLWHLWGRREYSRALEEFTIALKGAPNNAWLWQLIAAVHRRLGNWDEALAAFERAAQLNPLDADLFWDLGGGTYTVLGRYAEAVRAFDRALSLIPDLRPAALNKGWAYVNWRGELDTLRAALTRHPDATETRVRLLLLERNADSLLHVLRNAPARNIPVLQSQKYFAPTALYAAWAHQFRGDGPAARAAFDSALVVVDSAMRNLSDDWRVHVARGLTLAGLGRRGEALREARWLRQSPIYRTDAHEGPFIAIQRARILAQVGEADMAIDEIVRSQVAGRGQVSVPMLTLDHSWDPIRQHPRFQALLDKLGT